MRNASTDLPWPLPLEIELGIIQNLKGSWYTLGQQYFTFLYYFQTHLLLPSIFFFYLVIAPLVFQNLRSTQTIAQSTSPLQCLMRLTPLWRQITWE